MKTTQFSPNQPGGFTLIELLVSTALIATILVLMLGTVDQTQRVWQRSQSKITQFQSARAAFDTMSRRLSQATLNTYWKAHEAVLVTESAKFRFRRQAELQFVSGPMTRFLSPSPKIPNLNDPVSENYPTHAMFFAAPLGHTAYADPNHPEVPELRSLDSTLTACGYFIEFGDDPNTPDFLRKKDAAPRLRYRLNELTVPTEKFNIYSRPVDDRYNVDARIFDESGTNYYEGMVDKNRNPIGSWVRPLWMKEALSRTSAGDSGIYKFQYARVLAENVVALLIVPKLAVRDRVKPGSTTADPDALELAPKYEFDSWRVLEGKTETDPLHPAYKLDNRARDNLLPPIVQLVMVAIDEPSALRADFQISGKPDWVNRPSKLFQVGDTETKVLEDIDSLEKRIRDYRDKGAISYRIFSTDVVIRGSKWSRD